MCEIKLYVIDVARCSRVPEASPLVFDASVLHHATVPGTRGQYTFFDLEFSNYSLKLYSFLMYNKYNKYI